MTESPAKLSLGRRLQRQTTKLFSRSRSSRDPPASAPSGATANSSSRTAALRPERGPAAAGARSASHREATGKTVAIRNIRSGSAPREDVEQQEAPPVDLSVTKRVSDRAVAARVMQQQQQDVSDVEDDTDTEDRGNQRADGSGGPPRIGQADVAKNRVRLLDVGYASVVGSQDHENEDRLLLRSNEHFHLLSVMDGHGGDLAGQFVVQRLFERLEIVFSARGGFPDDPETDQALVRMMHALDDEFCAFARHRSDFSGVCVLAVVLYFDALETQSARKLVLNLGDCRVILREAVEQQQQGGRGALGPRVMALSTDHCASNRVEKMRICENGGYVRYGRVAGLLEPSRSIGDIDMKEPEMKNWVIATPEIRRRALAVGRSLLVLATDGIWGVLPNDKVMAVALEALSAPRGKRRKGASSAAENAVRAVVEAARRKGSVDDVTVIVAIV